MPLAHFILLLTIVFCLFFSRFTLTVAVLFLAVAAAISLRHSPSPPVRVRPLDKAALALPFLITAFYAGSLLWTADTGAGLHSLKVKGLFLVLPFTLWYLRPVSSGQRSAVFHLLIACCMAGAAWSLLQIPVQGLDLSDLYARGAVLPTPIHHIRFSLLCAFGAVLCLALAFRPPVPRRLPRWAYLAAGLAIAAYLHVLAVRSGLAGLYIGLAALTVPWFANGKRLIPKALLLLVVAGTFFAAYSTVPSLRSKIDYTLWSLKLYEEGNADIAAYSDSRRLMSYEAAVDVIARYPLLGAGVGDVRTEVQQYYSEHHPQLTEYVQPHNQYLWTAAAIGIPGAVLLLIFNLVLLARAAARRDGPLVAFNLIWMASFLVEDTLEMQIGVAAYLFFNYLGGPGNGRLTSEADA